MAIVHQYGKPNLFITMTCNLKWEEIVSALKPDEITNDCPNLVTRVFVGKLQHLLDELLKKAIFGEVVLTFMSLSGRRKVYPMHTFCSFCTSITNHEGPMNTTAWCLQSCLIRMHTPLFLRLLQVACCMAPVAPSTHIALAWLSVCSKGYRKAFTEHTTDTIGSYPTYRRRDDGRTFER
jgi:hypothetical protein